MSRRAALWGSLLGPLRRAADVRARLGRRSRQTTVEELDGVPVVVLPDVYNPVTHRTGAMMARVIRDAVPQRPVHDGAPRMLDLGAGSGVAGVFAALAGADVVAVDLSPEAVRNVRLNAQLHHVEHRIDARQGDLFAPVRGERFDVIAFDPPKYRGRPATYIELAWQGVDVLERFVAGLDEVLAPSGVAYVSSCSTAASAELGHALIAAGFEVTTAASRVHLGSTEAVLSVRRPDARP